MKAQEALIGAAAFAVVLLGVYIYRRGFGGAAQDAAAASTEAAAGVVKGAALGVSRTVGIPDTDEQKCQAALAAGDYWNASFYCQAGTFISEGLNAAAHAIGIASDSTSEQP